MLVIPSVKVKFSIAECSFMFLVLIFLFLHFYIKTIQQINNAGTNKGFRPLLQFSDEDIKQVYVTNNFLFILLKYNVKFNSHSISLETEMYKLCSQIINF